MFWFSLFDIIGTVAFAISGALAGIKKNLDLFGVITLSITTASFGGLMRDTFIGKLPPTIFTDPKYVVISFTTAVLTFTVYPKFLRTLSIKTNKVGVNLIFLLDAIGLGAFTALGTEIAISHNMNNLFSVIFMGLVSGVGGGVIRDVFIRDIPLILKKEIYALASIIGASIMFFSQSILPTILAMYLCFIATVLLRIISMKFKLNLPTAKICGDDLNETCPDKSWC